MLATSDVLLLPGLGDSGPAHWQTHWQTACGYARVVQRDWDAPLLTDWLAMLERTLAARQRPSLLVAHSLACALVAHYAQLKPSAADQIAGALLVAPADIEDPARTPETTRCFGPLPLLRLPFPSIVVASANDPFVSLERARHFAFAWGAAFEPIGAAGHINSDSELGDWPDGQRLLGRLSG